MALRLGVIADDFTGATAIAGFLVANGLATVQLNGVPEAHQIPDVDAVVVSLKSRSIPASEAVEMSLAADPRIKEREQVVEAARGLMNEVKGNAGWRVSARRVTTVMSRSAVASSLAPTASSRSASASALQSPAP